MTKVFSELEVSQRLVPTPEDFQLARQTFGLQVTEALAEGALVSSVEYGSVAQGTQNICSDYDVILVHDGSQRGLRTCRTIIAETIRATGYTVPIETPPYSVRQLSRPDLNEIDPSFGSHLLGENRVVRGVDIADYVRFSATDPAVLLKTYLANKNRSLSEKAAGLNPERQLRAMQRAIEAPIAVGRKVLWTLDVIQNTHRSPANSASKADVLAASQEFYLEIGAEKTPRVLQSANDRYRTILARTLEGKTPLSTYTALLCELDELILPTTNWLQDVQEQTSLYLARASST